MNSRLLLLLQAIGVFLQTANAQIGVITHDASLAAIIAAAVGGYQFYVQHLGNEIAPPAKPEDKIIKPS